MPADLRQQLAIDAESGEFIATKVGNSRQTRFTPASHFSLLASRLLTTTSRGRQRELQRLQGDPRHRSRFCGSGFNRLLFLRTIDGLVGQANVHYAHGRTKEALQLLHEVCSSLSCRLVSVFLCTLKKIMVHLFRQFVKNHELRILTNKWRTSTQT